VINPQCGRDWEDGVPDYVWYRAQREDAPDTLLGSHTTLVRMDDNSPRTYPYPASTSDPKKMAQSGTHHTGAAVSMEATNTIGGWFTKSGTGCIGLGHGDRRRLGPPRTVASAAHLVTGRFWDDTNLNAAGPQSSRCREPSGTSDPSRRTYKMRARRGEVRP